MNKIQKSCVVLDQIIQEHQNTEFLNKLSSPVFTLLIHSIVHLNRIPSEQEWKFIKKISYLNKSEHADCIAWKDYLILDLETSKVSFKFVSGIGVDITKLKYTYDKSGIALVSSALIDVISKQFPTSLLIDLTLGFDNIGNISDSKASLFSTKGNSGHGNKNRKIKNILLSGIYASIREAKISMPRTYSLLLRIIPKKYLKNRLSRINFEKKIVELPLDFTLVSTYPIMDKNILYHLELFFECNVLQILPIIHDILPITHPEFFPNNSYEGTYNYLSLIKKQNNVFFVSTTVRDEFQKIFPDNSIKSKNIFSLTNLFAEGIMERGKSADSLQRYQGNPYILTISTIEPRKNHLNLLLAMQHVFTMHKNLKLILLGGFGWKNDFIMHVISNSNFASRIEVVRNISENEKIKLIQRSLFTVYPSMYEGFGLPILEALLLSKRVLLHNKKPMTDFENLPGAIVIDMDNIDLLQKTLVDELDSKIVLDNLVHIQEWLKDQNNAKFFDLLTRLSY